VPSWQRRSCSATMNTAWTTSVPSEKAGFKRNPFLMSPEEGQYDQEE
jgi:hypothetical protein